MFNGRNRQIRLNCKMKKYILNICLLLVLPFFAYSQAQISNVKFELNGKDRTIRINYDIDFNSPEDSVYISAVGGKSGVLKSQTLSGDVGKGIKTGPNKLIVWDFMTDSLKINENLTINIFVKIHDYRAIAEAPKTEQKETTETKQASVENVSAPQKAEPTKPLVSKIKPTKVKGKINVATLAILGTGLAAGVGMVVISTGMKSTAESYYKIYQSSNVNQKITVSKDDWLSNYSAVTIAKANKDLALANDQLKKANLLFYGGIAVAALDLVYSIPRLRKKTNKKVSFQPIVSPNGTLLVNANIKF
jgi:hypothetical protein